MKSSNLISMNKKITFCTCYCLSLSNVSVVFSVSSSHSNTSLQIRRFPQKQLLVSKYSSILHTLLHLKLHVLGFLIKPFPKEFKSPNFLHFHRHSLWLHFCFELNIHSFNLHLHSHNLCWTINPVLFTPYINVYYLIWNTKSSICMINSIANSTRHINTNIKGIKLCIVRVYINKCLSRFTWLIV